MAKRSPSSRPDPPAPRPLAVRSISPPVRWEMFSRRSIRSPVRLGGPRRSAAARLRSHRYGQRSSISGTGNALTALGLARRYAGPRRWNDRARRPDAHDRRHQPQFNGDQPSPSEHWQWTVSTLNQLNTALAANDLQASINSTGAISITTTNNAASNTVGAISGRLHEQAVLRSPAWPPVVRLRSPIRTRRPPAPA